jgi:putative nucleotidyltransferase with HDIG domain
MKKPLNKEELLKTIKEYSNLRNYNLDAQLISAINGLCTIPTLPDIYIKLEREMNRPSISLNRVAEIISEDPLLVARIFHIAHSSFYNIPNGLIDLLQSINFLGVNIIKSLILYVKIFTLKNVSSETEIILKKIRIHSINVAKLTKAIIEKETNDRELIERAYIAGLLHDVGKIVLLQLNEKQRDPSYINNIQKFDSPDFERNTFGISHVDVGAYILGLWKFPQEIIEAVASHHNTSLIKDNVLSLKQAVFIANLFSNKFDDIAVRLAETYGLEKLNEWNQLMKEDERLNLNHAEN